MSVANYSTLGFICARIQKKAELMDYRSLIEPILVKAAQLAKKRFGKVKSRVKDHLKFQLVSQADLEISKMMLTSIQKKCPQDNLIDEEWGAKDKGSRFTWVTDPIDGTASFVNRLPTYGCMVGLLKDDLPFAGGVVLPEFKEVYWAERGKGCFCNQRRLKIDQEKSLDKALVAYAINHFRKIEATRKEISLAAEILSKCVDFQVSDSVYETCMVLKGSYGARLCRTSKIWDNVAPQILIEEAGGVYTDFQGKPMDYSQALKRTKENFSFCSGAPKVHRQLQRLIRKYY
jgi:myo-inositol-1(or 4)-monophosphatase